MDKDYLILKRASAPRPSGEWDDDDFDVLADGVVVGRIMKTEAVPVGSPWMWTLAFWHHEDRISTHGYAATREAAMAAADERGGSNRHPALLEREDCTLVAWYRSLRTSHGRGRMTVTIGRRELLAAFGGAAVAWPLAAQAL